jgi:bifunctional non-homologous end joining protein LigD
VKDRLDTYRSKRDRRRTPEPVPAEGPLPRGEENTFVIQEHHASSLHWDFRLERGGVLVSWAIPRGLPHDPKRNNLAVQTEDHPLEYASFEGEIPAGEYGGGKVMTWDRGHYDLEKWSDKEVKVVLHGKRARGRYVLFRTDGKNWMIHRMDPPDPGWEPLPELIRPMLATLGDLPPPDQDDQFGYEMKWDGVRAVVYVSGGRVRAMTRNDREVSGTYPELRGLGEALGSLECVLDGELVAFDERGRISFGALQPRMHVVNQAAVRRLVDKIPVTYLIFDVLHLDGRSTVDLPYTERRRLLESLELSGPRWQTPPYFVGGGKSAQDTSRAQGLEGVLAKRLDSKYLPGRRTRDWIKVKNTAMQEVVIGGWKPGSGRRAGVIGSLLLGIPGERGLTYVGHVGTGFTQSMLVDLTARLRKLERRTCPFNPPPPREHAKDAHWVTPKLVGEVAYGEITKDGILRHPSWRGLRDDKAPEEVTWELPVTPPG